MTKPEDPEQFCGNCFAGMESSEHHEKCVRPEQDATAPNAILAAIAATLRQAAGWGLEWPGPGEESAEGELLTIANAVETLEPDDPICPLCEEVICDENCALAVIRRRP